MSFVSVFNLGDDSSFVCPSHNFECILNQFIFELNARLLSNTKELVDNQYSKLRRNLGLNICEDKFDKRISLLCLPSCTSSA